MGMTADAVSGADAWAPQVQPAGLVLPWLRLWLDPRRVLAPPQHVFVSHAHSDHTARHPEPICTVATARLMQVRLPGQRQAHQLAFGCPLLRETDGIPWQITLFPAGHILGSAMALVEGHGPRVLYTGDFKLRSGWAAEPCAPQRADTLILETTFGRPQYVFPPASTVLAEIIRFCQQSLDRRETPILFAYALGKSQALLRGLVDAALPLALDESVLRHTRVYEELGQTFPAYTRFEPAAVSRCVVLASPGSTKVQALRASGRARCAWVTGWALDRGFRFRAGVDAAFPLSDHADFPELLEFVERVQPRRIYTVHGFATDFARTLREMGMDARALGQEEQLDLPLAPARQARRGGRRAVRFVPGPQRRRASRAPRPRRDTGRS